MAKFEQQVDVLLIDDEKHFTELAENYLGKSKNNLNLETMETAEKAIDLIDKFDIIVSDYRLPGMDGIDLLKKVREEGSDKPFIVFTGRGRENVAMKALNLGADSYLQKGGDPRTQFAVLENTINKVLDHWVSKKRFEDLFKSTDDLILKVNSEGKILSVNPALAEFLGKKVDEIEGKTLKKVFPGKVAEKRLQVGKKAIEVKETKVLEDQVGEKHFYNIFVPVDRLGEKDTLQIISREITQRKKKEKKLKKKLQKFKTLFEENPQPTILLDEDFRIQDVNTRSVEVFGYTLDEVKGKNFKDLVATFEGNGEIFKEKKDLESFKKESEIVKEDGENLKVYLSSKPVFIDGKHRFIVGLRDVSEDKAYREREDFLHSLLRHDLRNKTQIIQGFVELALDTELNEEQKNFLLKAENACEEGIELIETVRTLRTLDDEDITEIDLQPFIDGAIDKYKVDAAEKGIEIVKKISAARVKGTPLIREMFSNLLENAIIHSGGKKVKIATEEKNDKIVLKVEDDGEGIKDSVKEKVFDKEFREGENAGSGLGLFLVKNIAERFGGEVDVGESELGGAKFTVSLKKA